MHQSQPNTLIQKALTVITWLHRPKKTKGKRLKCRDLHLKWQAVIKICYQWKSFKLVQFQTDKLISIFQGKLIHTLTKTGLRLNQESYRRISTNMTRTIVTCIVSLLNTRLKELLGYVQTIPDSFWAVAKTIPGGAFGYTQFLLSCAVLISEERHIS